MKDSDVKKYVILAVVLVVLYGGYSVLKGGDICLGLDGKPCDFKNHKDRNKNR